MNNIIDAITVVEIPNPTEYKISSKKEALQIVGGLSTPSKMPHYAWGISPKKCIRGGMLYNNSNKNTICKKCYARKGRYVFSNVTNAWQIRFNKYNDPRWVDAMVYLLKNEKYFRWFDSGDLQSIEMLSKIVKICEQTPSCLHRLNTREWSIVGQYLDNENNKIPDNLCIRLSSDVINENPFALIKNCQIATVTNDPENKYFNSFKCPVTFDKSAKTCVDANCYACWDKEVFHVTYKQH